MTPREIAERWPGFLEAHRRPAGFETTESVVARATESHGLLPIEADRCGRIAEDGLRSAIAITHSGLIRSLRRHLGAADEPVPNLGGVWVHLGRRRLAPGAVVHDRWADGQRRRRTRGGSRRARPRSPAIAVAPSADWRADRSSSRRDMLAAAGLGRREVPQRRQAADDQEQGGRHRRRPDRRRPSAAARGSSDRSARAARRPG